MAATTRRPETSILRFDAVARGVHWVNAALFTTLIVTGAALYLQPVGAIVGRRALVQDIHVYAGVALPVPLFVAIAGRWGRGLRADLRRFNRWSSDDRLWLWSVFRARPERRRAM